MPDQIAPQSELALRMGRFNQRMMAQLQKLRARRLPEVVPEALEGMASRAGAIEAHLYTVRTKVDGYFGGGLRYASTDRSDWKLKRFPMQMISPSARERLIDDQAVIVTPDRATSGGPLFEQVLNNTGGGCYFLCPIQMNGKLRGMLGLVADSREVFEREVCRLLRQSGIVLYWGIRMSRRDAKQRRKFREWKRITAKACDLAITLDGSRRIESAVALASHQSMRHLLGRRITELVDLSFHAELQHVMDLAIRNRTVHMVNFRLTTGESSSRWYAARIDAVQPNRDSITMYLTDNHEDQTRREELRGLQSQLREFGRLRLIGKMNTEFNHQLNQPMQAIRMRLNTLERKIRLGRDNREDTLRVLELVEETIEHSKEISASIRLFVQQGRLEVGPVALDDLLSKAFTLASPLARDHGAVLEFPMEDSGLDVVVEPVQTSHVLLNLLLNAVEACRDAKVEEARVIVSVEIRDSNRLAIMIRDNGPGLPPERLENLFQEFNSTKVGGTGVGLTISRDICVAQDGDLSAFNNPDGPGCTFWFTLRRSGSSEGDTIDLAAQP